MIIRTPIQISDIRYLISEFRHVKLSLFDGLGREAATLVNKVKEPGTYAVEFNASRLSSGVYYRTQAGDPSTSPSIDLTTASLPNGSGQVFTQAKCLLLLK